MINFIRNLKHNYTLQLIFYFTFLIIGLDTIFLKDKRFAKIMYN